MTNRCGSEEEKRSYVLGGHHLVLTGVQSTAEPEERNCYKP